MRREIAAADRKREVRQAARSWRSRGKITAETLARIERIYADDRSRAGKGFRILLFVFTVVGAFSAYGLLLLVGGLSALGGSLFFMSIVCFVFVEILTVTYKRSGSGAEEAAAFLAVVFLLAAAAWALIDTTNDLPWRMWFFLAAGAWTFAAWQWGSWPYGAFAALSLLGISVSSPATRLYWILCAGILTPVLLKLSRSAHVPPSHRRASDAALLVLLSAAYLAVHVGSYDSRLLEGFGWSPRGDASSLGRLFSIGGTALLPLSLLLAGIHTRLPILFRTGVAFGVISLVTLRFYVHVAPLWVVLTLSGGAALAVALLLRRYLADGPDGERDGFTADPLDEHASPADALEMGLSAALSSEAPERAGSASFKGGGGEFGGGGAGGKY